MNNKNRPRAREKKVTGSSKGTYKKGQGLGTGKVGSGSFSGSSTSSSGSPLGSGSSGGGHIPKRAAAGGGGLVLIIGLILALKNGGLGGLLGGLTSSDNGSGSGSDSGYSASIEGKVNTSVASGSRDKRTQILGNNKDTVTMMVYMCGTDLESKHGMATSDLNEMLTASKKFGNNFNLIIYTGGCNKWQNNTISSKKNQIIQIKNGKIIELEEKSSVSMTDPDTLSSFIKYCSSNFPANRNELVFWDHGGGSVTGYGYDEKHAGSGSMDLAEIDKALKNGGVKFDFIGFDACLMATAENALMLNDHADYLIASEETEPGIGWYYTDWLADFGSNTSRSTLDIGKDIVDSFVSECNRKCRGQKTTLSVIDLAEFSHTVPEKLADFSKSITNKISKDDFKEVSDARYATREFAQSSKIDQVDLVHLAKNMDTPEGKELSKALQNAVKYNLTSSNMTNAYGVSIYFPYQKTSSVDKACKTYQSIGMDSEYAECIRKFASLETSGQAASGGTSSPIGSLFGLGGSSGTGSADMIGSLLGSFLGGNRNIDGLDDSNTDYMQDQDIDSAAEYIAENQLDSSLLVWDADGSDYVMKLPESQWDLIHAIDMNMFYYDGDDYIDLGLDNIFSYDDDDNLVADTDRNWVAINGQPVAYYHTDTIENENGKDINTGYVPALLNGDRVNLIIVFEGSEGYIAGASDEYTDNETDAVAKSLTELSVGDELTFICDYYSDDMEYQDSYQLGETMTFSDNMEISNVDVGSGKVKILYRFTDIYNQEYWSEAIDT